MTFLMIFELFWDEPVHGQFLFDRQTVHVSRTSLWVSLLSSSDEAERTLSDV